MGRWLFPGGWGVGVAPTLRLSSEGTRGHSPRSLRGYRAALGVGWAVRGHGLALRVLGLRSITRGGAVRGFLSVPSLH